MVKIKKIDHEAFEPLIIYKCLLDASYLGTIVEYLKPEYFSNENIKNIIEIITDFYKKTSESPTITEIKTYLVTDKQKQSWKNVVESFNEIDKNLNIKELYENPFNALLFNSPKNVISRSSYNPIIK